VVPATGQEGSDSPVPRIFSTTMYGAVGSVEKSGRASRARARSRVR
jgi:hypothetical protein